MGPNYSTGALPCKAKLANRPKWEEEEEEEEEGPKKTFLCGTKAKWDGR